MDCNFGKDSKQVVEQTCHDLARAESNMLAPVLVWRKAELLGSTGI